MTASANSTWGMLRRATVDDAARLSAFARQSFVDTFASANTAANMRSYLASAFGEDIQRGELADDRHVIFIAEREGEIVGYVMLRHGPAPDCVADTETIEIMRLYAGKSVIGSGLGASLMQRALDEGAAQGKSTVWLGVWEHNPRAIAFYRRWGFEQLGTQTFLLGTDRQMDHVMARRIG